MNTEEYIPNETETAVTIHETVELVPETNTVRIRCDGCSLEVGGQMSRQHAFDLLQKTGWKIGAKIICPQCVQKAARKFFKRYSPSE